LLRAWCFRNLVILTRGFVAAESLKIGYAAKYIAFKGTVLLVGINSSGLAGTYPGMKANIGRM